MKEYDLCHLTSLVMLMLMTKRHQETHKIIFSALTNVVRDMHRIHQPDCHIQQHYQNLKLKIEDVNIQLSGKLICSESPRLAEILQFLVLTPTLNFPFLLGRRGAMTRKLSILLCTSQDENIDFLHLKIWILKPNCATKQFKNEDDYLNEPLV